jgi:hypothetical protein
LRVLEGGELRLMCGVKGGEVSRMKEITYLAVHTSHTSLDIIIVMKQKWMMPLAAAVTRFCSETVKLTRSRWDDNIKVDLK